MFCGEFGESNKVLLEKKTYTIRADTVLEEEHVTCSATWRNAQYPFKEVNQIVLG